MKIDQTFFLDRDYKEISLYGFLYMYLSIITLAVLADALLGNLTDMLIEIFALSINILALLYLHRTQNFQAVALILAWSSSLIVFLLVLANDFRHASYLFLFLAPFSFYLVLDRKTMVPHAMLYFLLFSLLMVYGFLHSDYRHLFDDPFVLSALLIATLFSIAVGVFIYFAIQLSFDRLEASNREKELLLKEVHHRVKNNLNMISSMIGLQSTCTDPKTKRMLERSRDRIDSIASVHEMLYSHNTFESIECSDYIPTLIANISKTYGLQTSQINLDITHISLPLDHMIYFALMLQEMLTNTVKHAGAHSIVTLSLEKKNTTVVMHYEDNGDGCSLETLKASTALGFSLIRFAVSKLKGTLEISTRSGLHYHLEFINA